MTVEAPAVDLPHERPVISFEEHKTALDGTSHRSKQIIETLEWLCSRVEEQGTSFDLLQKDFQAFQRDAEMRLQEAQQQEELLEHRFELMETAMRKPMMSISVPNLPGPGSAVVSARPDVADKTNEGSDKDVASGEDVEGGENDNGAPSDEDMMSMGMGMGGNSAAIAALEHRVMDAEGALRALSFSLKKLDGDMKHKESQQLQRDTAQDELFKMEMSQKQRQIENCIQAKDLEQVRNTLMSKIGHMEVELKDDMERAATNLKASLHEEINEVQAMLEKISGSTAEQVRLIDEKIETNSASDEKREKETRAIMLENRQKLNTLARQMAFIGETVGVSAEDLAEAGAPAEDEPTSPGLSPGAPKDGWGSVKSVASTKSRGGPGGAGGGGGGAVGERLDRLERRLNDALVELGIAVPEDVDNPEGGNSQSVSEKVTPHASGHASRSNSRPASRGALPERVEKLEVQNDDIKEALHETLGIVLPCDQEAQTDGTARPCTPPEKPKQGNEGLIPARLSALEQRMRDLAASLGVELPPDPVFGGGDADATARELVVGAGPGAAPGAGGPDSPPPKPMTMPQRVNLLDLKMDEVASALGLSPEELEAYAQSETKGNLAGRVVLKEQAEAVSPRMAGIVAAQEDKLSTLDSRLNSIEADVDGRFGDKINDHERRIGVLEDLGGVPVAAGRGGGKGGATRGGANNLEWLENRVQGLVNEDLKEEAAAGGDKKRRGGGGGAGGLRAAGGGEAGGTGASDTLDDNEELLQACADEIRAMKQEMNDVQGRLKKMAGEMQQNHQHRDGPPVATENRQSTPVDNKSLEATREALARAESAAEAAAASAAAASKFREELEEIVKAVEVPSVGAAGFEDIDPADLGAPDVDPDIVEVDEGDREDAAREYIEKQAQVESRLQQLEEQLDKASVVAPESEIFGALKGVIKDVRRCLSRSELLFQLPEIKMFIKRFQKSLEVNAILHEKWIGPGAGRRPQEAESGIAEGPGRPKSGSEGTESHLARGSEHSRSAPDISSSTRNRRDGGLQRGKKSDGMKKKPFRTVVDWCRPHTPLKLDPVFKPSKDGGGGGRNEDPHHLPQISRG